MIWPLIDRIVFVIQLLIIFFIPYNVERPSRRIPYVTYSLMGINVFFFFVTVFISNVNLPADRIIGRQKAAVLLTENPTDETVKNALETAKTLDPKIETEGVVFTVKDDSDTESDAGSKRGMGVFNKKQGEALARQMLWMAATKLAFEKADSEEGYQRAWQIQHMDSTYVVSPHYSALEVFAYRPGEESIIGKLLGLAGSMFLHGDFLHIFFNMLFLWVFGRAVEDSLGPSIYLGAYLLCGIAASLLHHIMTQFLTPDQMMLPTLGASGAIAGVIGLFAPRYYRTPVRVFYLTILALVSALISLAVVGGILAMITGDITSSAVLAIGAILAGFYYFGRTWAWGTTRVTAIWFIIFYVFIQDIYPVLKAFGTTGDTNDGTAHWAHIGGLIFGILYAFLIGAQNEGKQEFMLEDATKAYDLGDMAGALSYSQNVLEREPQNPGAYEVLAKAAMKENDEDTALDNFELAIENYLRIAERGNAASLYLVALEKYPRFILKPAVQLAVGNQMAKDYDYKNAAETLVKIAYTFPEAGEGEVSLLRAAQLYIQHLDQPQSGLQLLQFFWQKFPESQWMPQVERAWKMAQHQINAPQASVVSPEPEPELEPPAPPELPRTRAQAVAPPLELEPVQQPENRDGSAAPPRQPRAPGT